MTASFTELGLSQELLKAVEDLGFEEPSPIQVLAIPALLTGKDAVGQAQTGTGKTAAFGLPILEKIASGKSVQALVLCPTRELAIQVSEELSKLAYTNGAFRFCRFTAGSPSSGSFGRLPRAHRWSWARRAGLSIICSAARCA